MNRMNIEATKLELMHLLLQTQKESLLIKLKNVFEQESKFFYSTDITDLQERAKASLESVEKGETRSIKDFKKELDHWKNQQVI